MPNEGVILLVEDNETLNSVNLRALRLRGYEAYAALTLQEAGTLLSKIEPDVILLDVMLPDGDGFDFCARIQGTVDAHIIFLTGKTEHGDILRGLGAGGDDYITKPFHPEELMARIESALRRRNRPASANILKKGGLTLDIIAARAFVGGEDMELPPKEFAVLLLLAQNEGKSVSAARIFEAVWKSPPVGHKNAVKTAVSRLRDKMRGTEFDIVTTRGAEAGYMFTRG